MICDFHNAMFPHWDVLHSGSAGWRAVVQTHSQSDLPPDADLAAMCQDSIDKAQAISHSMSHAAQAPEEPQQQTDAGALD